MTDSNTQARKRMAVQFLQLVAAGSIDEAYEKHVDLGGWKWESRYPVVSAAWLPEEASP